MNPLELHEKAMGFSFLAKQAREAKNEDEALYYYEQAANLESTVADYYLDKVELEPTRSTIIRSAAFLNLKAGLIENAEKFIFFGIINAKDKLIREQLYEALEICMTHRNLERELVTGSMEYIYALRRKSILYILEPKDPKYGNAVTLDMIADFSQNFIKSLKGYSKCQFKNQFGNKYDNIDREENAAEQFQAKINPIVTNAAFGSFKFSLAVDFLPRIGESTDFIRFKSNILLNYHNDIFINDFSDEEIIRLKQEYTIEEIEEIFRPIFRMRSKTSAYEIGYYDRETLRKEFIPRAKNKQKAKLLPVRKISVDDIGYLEYIISHTHLREGGTALRETLLTQKLTVYEFDVPTKIIEPKGYRAIILNQEIIVKVKFDTEIGFTISYDELGITVNDTQFTDGFNKFFLGFLEVVQNMIQKLTSKSLDDFTEQEKQYYSVIKRLISNPDQMNKEYF